MKNLFNNISQEEKNRILEMHSGKTNLISEQVKGNGREGRRNPEWIMLVNTLNDIYLNTLNKF